MGIDEIIELSSYQDEWKDIYDQEKKKLEPVFAKQAVEFAHIGSTSVEGMTAKPIVDILIGLKELHIDEQTDRQLVALQYESMGEAGVPGRIHYRKRIGQKINLQITVWDSAIWRDNLLFRDYLRTHPEQANAYAQAKRNTLASGINTLLKYSDEKSGTIAELLKQAREWAKL
ncbi:GrpB family protein [Paenibacillus sp. S28]|nr:GrpB family protein [Paenibacillus sp. S28]MBJ9992781.1 GrpB family protein [Paenibacillus sp. S28]